MRGVDELFVEFGVANEEFFDEVAAVFLVENGEAGFESEGFDFAADNGEAEVVKGGDGESFAFGFSE